DFLPPACRSRAHPFDYRARGEAHVQPAKIGTKLRKEYRMSRVRVLVGTRKGAFLMTSDAKREQWDISGPHFTGWEIYHLKGSPADPNRLYAAQHTSWHGQLIQRSNDGGKTWEAVGNKFVYEGEPGTHLWYDGTPRPFEFVRVWHLRSEERRVGKECRSGCW